MVNPARKRRGGKKGSTRRTRRKGGKRGKRSSYRSFVKREMPALMRRGMAPKQAMKAIGRKWSGGKKSAKRTSHRRGRSNWGTRAGGRKGWNKREAHAKGYKRTRGARFPPKRRSHISKARRSRAAKKGWARKMRGAKRRANPRRRRRRNVQAAENPRRHRRRKHGGRKRSHKRANARRRRSRRRNPMSFGTAAKIDRHIKPTYGRAHMKFMASCLRQRGGKGGMKACAKLWRKQSGKHGRKQPHWKRRANPEYALAPSHLGGKLSSIGSKLGFPSRKELFPTWEEVKAHKLATVVGGSALGVPSALGMGGLFRMAAPKSPVGAEVLGIGGGILGTELPARIWKKWGPERAYKSSMVKSVRAWGYGATTVSAILGIVKLAQAKGGKLSGLGDVTAKAKEFAKEVAAKAKKALGMGLFRRKHGMEDVVSSGWDQGYTGNEPLGVSGPMDEAMSKLDTRIKALAKELGLSDVEVTEMMQREGYDLGAYPSYVNNPYPSQRSGIGTLGEQLSDLGQYGSPSVPLLSDSIVPPGERDIFRSDFVV